MWSAFGSIFGRGPAIKEINVHFGKRKLRVTLTPEDYDSQKQVPLNAFRTKLANALKVPPRELVLYHVDPQRKLGNMKATLEEYGIKNGGDILAVHVKPDVPQKPAPKPKASVTERVDEIVNSVDTELGDRIAKLVKEGPPADPEQRETENRVLSEVVLAKTIALDDVEVHTPKERQHRKNAIAKLQKYHKDIDAAMAKSPRQDDAAAANAAPASAKHAEQGTQTAPSAPGHVSEDAAGSSNTEEAANKKSSTASPSVSNSQPRKKKTQNKKKKGKR